MFTQKQYLPTKNRKLQEQSHLILFQSLVVSTIKNMDKAALSQNKNVLKILNKQMSKRHIFIPYFLSYTTISTLGLWSVIIKSKTVV